MPPLPTTNIPEDTSEAFKFVSDAPEPEKLAAVIFVAEMVVQDETPVNVPPVKGNNKDNVEDIGVPFLYISAQLITVNTSKA